MHARTHTHTRMLTRAQSVHASTGVHTQKFTHASTRAKIARVRVRVRVRAATQMLAHARVRAHVCAHTRPLTHVCTVTVHAGLCESTDLPTPLNTVRIHVWMQMRTCAHRYMQYYAYAPCGEACAHAQAPPHARSHLRTLRTTHITHTQNECTRVRTRALTSKETCMRTLTHKHIRARI